MNKEQESKTELPHEQAVPSQRYMSYGRPLAILNDADLSHKDKRALLEEWKLDSERLIQSSGEGMLEGEESPLSEVEEALRRLETDQP